MNIGGKEVSKKKELKQYFKCNKISHTQYYIKPPYTPRALRAYISLVKRKKRMIEEAKKNRLE